LSADWRQRDGSAEVKWGMGEEDPAQFPHRERRHRTYAVATVVILIVAPLAIACNVDSPVLIFGQPRQRRSIYISLVWMHQHLDVITAPKKGKLAGAQH
jgi:hypothetical protein